MQSALWWQGGSRDGGHGGVIESADALPSYIKRCWKISRRVSGCLPLDSRFCRDIQNTNNTHACWIVYMILMFMCTHPRAHPLLDKHSGALCPRLHKDLVFSKNAVAESPNPNRKKQPDWVQIGNSFFLMAVFEIGIFGKKGSVVESGSPQLGDRSISNPPTRMGKDLELPRGSEPHWSAGKLISVANLFTSTSLETSCLRWCPRCIQCLAALLFDPNLQPIHQGAWMVIPSLVNGDGNQGLISHLWLE